MPMLAVGTALISVVGANYGAHNFENIRIVHRYSMNILRYDGCLLNIIQVCLG